MSSKENKMKIAFLTTANSHKGGGVFEVVCQLGSAIYHKGVNITISWREDNYTLAEKHLFGDTPLLEYDVSHLFPLRVILYSHNLLNNVEGYHPNILHSHGLWMYNSKVTKSYKQIHPQVKTVITPHGALDPWAVKNSYWKKKFVSWWYEDENLRMADCIQALNYSEYESIRKYGLSNPVAIIPNGINLPIFNIQEKKQDRILLFIGRIHPKKGIAELLEGLHIVKRSNPKLLDHWKVRIAGWDQLGHIIELKAKCSEYGLNDVISFIGPVLGKDKENELCRADAFVLTSFSEGLPMSVLEAWAYKLPVVMTDHCNLPDGFESQSAIRVTTEPESIATGLEQLFKMSDEERRQMGGNGYNLVESKYTWDKVADQTVKLYDWLLHGGDKPDFVIID